jgi:hypothetical protein
MTVVVMVILAVALGAIVTLCGWAAVTVREPAGTVDHARAAPAPPQTLEGALVLQLLNAEINGRQYLHAMELLAARDADRHPLGVPPED